MTFALLLSFLFVLAAAAFLWWRAVCLERAAGLPMGEVVYTDTGVWERVEHPLFDPVHRLIGRPDYLVRVHGGLIPVEVKSGPCPPVPHTAHVLQLAAYCLLAESVGGQSVPFGYLRYDDVTVRIPFTDRLRRDLLASVEAIRRGRTRTDVERSHRDPARCRGCGVRHGCNQRLA
jgi:CRISPR-associated exonuclease Cas4